MRKHFVMLLYWTSLIGLITFYITQIKAAGLVGYSALGTASIMKIVELIRAKRKCKKIDVDGQGE